MATLASLALGVVGGACALPSYDVDPSIDALVAGKGGVASGGASAHAGSGTGGTSGTGSSGAPTMNPSAGAPAGNGGASAAAGAGACPDETSGSVPKSPGKVTPAIVLIDDVVVQDAKQSRVIDEWQFNDGATIADTETDPRPGNRWSRTSLFGDPNKVSRVPGAHSTFLSCDGAPTNGSVKNLIPFSLAGQYYEVSVLFQPADYSGDVISAKVKLVAGGAPDEGCPAHAMLYGIGITGTQSAETPNEPITLSAGAWLNLTLTVPSTGFTKLGELGVRVTTYPCL